MKLLITGAFGLVGSNICSLLESDYPEIEITKVKFDEAIEHPEYKFDYIIHAAGYGQPLKFSREKLNTIKINTDFIYTLFHFMKPGGKFLFVSTSEVYSGAPSPHKETDIGTTTPQHPRACYIEGKRCGEAICMAYKEQGYDVKIARLALAYGPGTKKGDTRVLNQFIEAALVHGNIHLRDEGKAVRTYCYVEDAAKQILNILFKGKDIVYNVGGINTTSILGLACEIKKITDCLVITRGVYDCLKTEDKSAPDDVRLDMTKTLSEFPMEFVSLDEGLKKTIEYQKTLYGK